MNPHLAFTPATPLAKITRTVSPSSRKPQISMQTSTPKLTRRAFNTILAATSLLPLPSLAGDISGLVQPYKDLPKGFAILRPNGWNEFEGLQDNYDIKWQDIIQPLEFITVLTTPLPKQKSLDDLGLPKDVGDRLATARRGKLIQATTKDIEGIPAYLFEIQKDGIHQLTLLTVNKQKLYSVNASSSEKRWKRREQLLRGVVDSFRPKL